MWAPSECVIYMLIHNSTLPLLKCHKMWFDWPSLKALSLWYYSVVWSLGLNYPEAVFQDDYQLSQVISLIHCKVNKIFFSETKNLPVINPIISETKNLSVIDPKISETKNLPVTDPKNVHEWLLDGSFQILH